MTLTKVTRLVAPKPVAEAELMVGGSGNPEQSDTRLSLVGGSKIGKHLTSNIILKGSARSGGLDLIGVAEYI
jgi:hypothetical protein